MLAFGLGAVIGVILALTGAGGGILAVPMLVFGLQMGVADAGPIGLLAVGIAAASGAALGLREGIVRYRAAALIAVSGMLASPLGLWLAQRMDNRWLTILFSVVLLVVAWRSFRSRQPQDVAPEASAGKPCGLHPATGRFAWTAPCARAFAGSGAVAGMLSGLLGVGGGFVIVPALQRFTALEIRSVVATSLAVIALVSVAGVVGSAASGGLAWKVAVPFAAGALGGMLGGRAVSTRLPGRYIQLAFAIVSALVAAGMLVKSVF
jgi:hypothetical protein